MNVRDMIDLLGSFPEDMRVVVNGYEQGYDDLSPEQISVVPITLNTGEHDWDGQHGRCRRFIHRRSGVRDNDQGPAAPPNIQLILSMGYVISIRLPSSRLAAL